VELPSQLLHLKYHPNARLDSEGETRKREHQTHVDGARARAVLMLTSVQARIPMASACTIHVLSASTRKVASVLLCSVCLCMLLSVAVHLQL
jgi:hypothetical protein